jgi:hypothetical protein
MNVKMGEIFLMYGNPFSRRSYKKNCYLIFCVKYYPRIIFQKFHSIRLEYHNEFELKDLNKNYSNEKLRIIPFEKERKKSLKNENEWNAINFVNKTENNIKPEIYNVDESETSFARLGKNELEKSCVSVYEANLQTEKKSKTSRMKFNLNMSLYGKITVRKNEK